MLATVGRQPVPGAADRLDRRAPEGCVDLAADGADMDLDQVEVAVVGSATWVMSQSSLSNVSRPQRYSAPVAKLKSASAQADAAA